MKRLFFILFAVLFILSCSSEKEKHPVNFYSIDLSRSNGWRSFYSIYVDSTGNYLIKIMDKTNMFFYFKGHLTDSVFDNVIALTDSINKTEYVTSSLQTCDDCPYYKIILHSKMKELKQRALGYGNLKYIDNLASVFTELSHSKNLTPVDTSYDFESFKDFIPQMEPAKFTPPISKD